MACSFGEGEEPPKAVCAPPPADLVAWWTFDEPAGPVAHGVAGWPNDLVFGGNPIGVGGYGRGGWRIPHGVGGSTPGQGDLALGTGSFTLEFWIFRWGKLSSSSRILGKNGGGDVGSVVVFANGQVGMGRSGTDYWPPPWSGAAWSTGWRHVAVTVDRGAGNVVRWYVDGQQTAQAAATNWLGTADAYSEGDGPEGDADGDGDLYTDAPTDVDSDCDAARGAAVVCIGRSCDDNGHGVQEATEPYLGGGCSRWRCLRRWCWAWGYGDARWYRRRGG